MSSGLLFSLGGGDWQESLLKRKQDVIAAAVELFARQGYDATTTFELARAAGVTEPVIYYHFKSKDGLFSHILKTAFDFYFSRLKALPTDTETAFEKIENLINFHFHIIDEKPNEVRIITSVCPAKLGDSAHICTRLVEEQRLRLTRYVSSCIEKGVETGEFYPVPVEVTAGIVIAFVNGLLRRRSLKLDQIDGLMEASVDFCRRSLTKISLPLNIHWQEG